MEATEKLTIQESTVSKPDKPERYERRGATIHKTFKSFFLSRKLLATVFSLIVLSLAYYKQVDYLYAFATYPESTAAFLIPAFISLTRDVMLCFTAIIGTYIGAQSLVQWKHGTESVINQTVSSISENIKRKEDILEKREEKIEHIEHLIQEGQNGAPEVKPFSQNAVGE